MVVIRIVMVARAVEALGAFNGALRSQRARATRRLQELWKCSDLPTPRRTASYGGNRIARAVEVL
jgi:hypothetical protein